MAKINWPAIKKDYITDPNASYRKLAEKHGVGESTLFVKASREKWVEQKEQFQSKTVARTIDAVSNRQADRAAKLATVADLLLDRVKELVEGNPAYLTSTQSIKHLSGVLKDLKEVQMIRSDADLREQEARIRNLEKAAAAADSAPAVTVLLEGGADEYVS